MVSNAGIASGGKCTPENLDRVASLDRLRLLPIAQHLDRHAGAGLQLQQLDHRPRADLARLVQHQHCVPVSVEVTRLDHLQQGCQGVGPLDARVLQGVRLAPGHRRADHLPPFRAKPRVRLPRRYQRLQQRRFPSSRNARQQTESATLSKGVDGGGLLVREPDAACPHRASDRGERQGAQFVGPKPPGQGRQLVLDPDLGGVCNAKQAVRHADDERYVLALEPNPPLLHQLDNALDVLLAAGDAHADQAARSVHADLLVAQHGCRVELLGKRFGRELVSTVEPLLVGQRLALGTFHNRTVRPAQRLCLLAPDAAFVGLHLPELACLAGLFDDLQLAVGRELVPLQTLAGGKGLGVPQDLAVPLAVRIVGFLWDGGQHNGLPAGIIVDVRAEPPQFVCEDRLEERPKFLDPGIGQRPRVQRADPAIVGDDQVHQEVVDMRMRVAGDRGIEQVSLAPCPVLDVQRWSGGVMAEADPPNVSSVGTVLASPALSAPSRAP